MWGLMSLRFQARGSEEQEVHALLPARDANFDSRTGRSYRTEYLAPR